MKISAFWLFGAVAICRGVLAAPTNPVLAGDASWQMTDTDWFTFQRSEIAECVDVPIYGFDGTHPPTVHKWMQTRLNAMGFDAGEPDGVLGGKTKAAIAAFAKYHGLSESQVFPALIPDACFSEQPEQSEQSEQYTALGTFEEYIEDLIRKRDLYPIVAEQCIKDYLTLGSGAYFATACRSALDMRFGVLYPRYSGGPFDADLEWLLLEKGCYLYRVCEEDPCSDNVVNGLLGTDDAEMAQLHRLDERISALEILTFEQSLDDARRELEQLKRQSGGDPE